MPGIKSAVAFVAMLVVPGAFAAAPISDTDRQQVLEAVIAHLETEYIDPDAGRRAAKKLRDKSAR